jgi:hypothetical protein
MGSGDWEAYRRECARLLAHFAGTEDNEIRTTVVVLCSLRAGAFQDVAEPVRWAEKSVAEPWGAFGPFWQRLFAYALALYRAGRYDAALQRATESIAADPSGDSGLNWVLMAMIHQRLGHAAEARRWLAKSRGWRGHPDQYSWHLRLEHQVLLREAEALLKQPLDVGHTAASTNSAFEEIVHRHRPSRHGRFGVRDLPASVYPRRLRSARAIDANHLLAQQIDIPDDLRASGEVVGAFDRDLLLGTRRVVSLAPNFDCEYGRALKEPHPGAWAGVVRRVGAERRAMRQIDPERFVVTHGSTLPYTLHVLAQRRKDLVAGITGHVSCG